MHKQPVSRLQTTIILATPLHQKKIAGKLG